MSQNAAENDKKIERATKPNQKKPSRPQANPKLFAVDKPQYEMGFIENHDNANLANRGTARYGQEQAPPSRAQGH